MDDGTEFAQPSAMWSTPDGDQVLLDADCSPTKTCKNMVGISFDGFAEPGTELAAAWRARLEREGKITGGSDSVRDLVLGTPDS